MRRKITLITLAAMLSALLCGCLPWSAEDSYKLPKPPQDYENLMKVVAQSKRELAQTHSTTVEDVPPSTGDHTSTIQLLDMDDNGEQETAVTFFRVVGAPMPVRIYFYRLQEDGSYQVSNIVEGEGDGVHAVHYADLDGAVDAQGLTNKEIVVSWQMGTEAKYLAAYTLEDAPSATQMMAMTTYESYRLADLDRDGLMELTVSRIDTEQNLVTAEMYDWDPAGQAKVSVVPLSSGLVSVQTMRANYLTDLIPALYITGQTPDGSRVTDVVALRNGQLTNLSLDPQTGVSREVVGPYRDIPASDVNNDYIFELGRPQVLENQTGTVSPWLLDWVQYNSKGRVKDICTTYHNYADGWYLVIPEHWQSRLVVYRNDSVSGQRAVIFARWQGEDKEPIPFLSVYKLTGASRSLRATSGSRFILAEDSSTIYAATFHSGWDCGLDQTELLENFRLIVSNWSMD